MMMMWSRDTAAIMYDLFLPPRLANVLSFLCAFDMLKSFFVYLLVMFFVGFREYSEHVNLFDKLNLSDSIWVAIKKNTCVKQSSCDPNIANIWRCSFGSGKQPQHWPQISATWPMSLRPTLGNRATHAMHVTHVVEGLCLIEKANRHQMYHETIQNVPALKTMKLPKKIWHQQIIFYPLNWLPTSFLISLSIQSFN